MNSIESPAITIRPHHVLSEDVRDALARRQSACLLAEEHVRRMGFLRAWPYRNSINQCGPIGYYSDVLGITHQDRQKFQRALEDFFTKLQELPDDSYAHLDLKPDGMCRACAIGKHCSATNYESESSPRSTVEGERTYLDHIRQELEKKGYILGVDFTVQPTTHTFYDLEGRTLSDPEEGIPQNIIFDSLIVRVSALRDIS